MVVYSSKLTKKEINGTGMHIESARGEKTMKNMETCAYNT